jgi:hypothetical protein
MYPLLARRSHLAVYLLLWLLMGVLLAAILALPGGLPWATAFAAGLPLAVAYSFICLSAWYVARAMPLAATGVIRVVATGLGAAILSSAMWLVLGRAALGLLSTRWPAQGERTFAAIQTLLFGVGVLLYLLALSVSYVLVVFEASQEAQRRGLQGQVLAREAELRSLRAQIDPHFLFNSLHSISALTMADPQGARRMCLLLGDFLRQTVAFGGADRITLSREMALIDNFLAIERVRFGDRLTVEVDAGNAGECLVPPLLLQPLVENAVTHGIAHLLDGGTVQVTAGRDAAWLRIAVDNPCDRDRPKRSGTGVGLANVSARLRALHGADATVVSEERGDRWHVELTLPAVEAEPS